MTGLSSAYDLDDYIDFINQADFAGRKLKDFVAETQRVYLLDNRPWVIGYSGGKDSSAVLTLAYLALLGLEPEQRKKPIFVVASDTLVETPVVVDHINRSLDRVQKGAEQDGLPITCHKVVPKANETFWANLLGKGYPAPTRNFRWCTERMKIDPVSDFIKTQVSKYDEVIVVLGSRSAESASRAQVIAKHKIDGSHLAKHTSLTNAYIYTPIDTWDVNDVWRLLRGGWQYNKDDVEEWDSPWGSSNRQLWTLYMESSGDQGECPLVIDESTPSCGNSRFGCWTCTVVTKDRAMESLISNGEEWMRPLLEFRDFLSYTSEPENKDQFRNFKRRTGKVSFQRAKSEEEFTAERKHVPGPYLLEFRQKWLRQLLEMEKELNVQGREIQLITEPELHAIRQEWLIDPNEPDWSDSLPRIYQEVTGKTLDWIQNDNDNFGQVEEEILEHLCSTQGIDVNMVKKLIEVEQQMDGLHRRVGIFDKLGSILRKDWVASVEELKERDKELQQKHEFDGAKEDIQEIEAELVRIKKRAEKEF